MPRFYYDFFDGETWSPDDTGLELPSAEQACLEAFAGARSMYQELREGRGDPFACAFEIRGEGGQSLFRFDFAELLGSASSSPAPERRASGLIETLATTHQRADRARAELDASLNQTLRALSEARQLITRLDVFGRPPAIR